MLLYAFLAAGIFARISVLKDGIRVEAWKLMKIRELKWHEIGWVVDDSWMGIHLYHLIPKTPNEKRISIPWSIKNYKKLLSEVVKYAKEAEVEETVKRLVEK